MRENLRYRTGRFEPGRILAEPLSANRSALYHIEKRAKFIERAGLAFLIVGAVGAWLAVLVAGVLWLVR